MGEWTLFCFPGCFHGCPEDSRTSTFHQDLPGFGQCLSFWLLPSSSNFWFPYRFSLWGSLTLSLKPWWVEPVSKRPELAFLVPFNPPSGEGASSPFLLLCHLILLQLPSHILVPQAGVTYQPPNSRSPPGAAFETLVSRFEMKSGLPPLHPRRGGRESKHFRGICPTKSSITFHCPEPVYILLMDL